MTIDWQLKHFDELTNRELYEILHLRDRIFVVEQQSIYIDADNYDQKAIHLYALHENRIIAYARAFKSGDKMALATFGRVLVDESFRRNGLGRELVRRSIEILSKYYNEHTIEIEAQLYLQKFYSDYGFKVIGEPYIEDNVPHIRMILHFE